MSKAKTQATKPAKPAAAAKAKTQPAKTDPTTPRAPSKTDLLTNALSQPGGATIEQLCSVTGWQSHSVRAAVSGFKKQGIEITRAKTDGKSVYAVAPLAETAQ